ncbi:MAG: PKD domain-containing protein, partial [Actinobacteria bacterium]|nr:PKD domain-containing protein [Actinomycetota bacterium]
TNPATQTGPFAGTVAWHSVRGAFMVNSTLFTLHADGTLVRRSFDGTTFGPGTATYTYANNIIADAPNMTGIFFDPETSRIYYTLSTSGTTLYYRSFLPESGVISALRGTLTGGAVTSLNPARVRGMFLADGQIWFGDSSSHDLLKIGFSGGTPTGSASTADTTADWTAGRAMFLTSLAPVNVAPTASFTATCSGATCDFDAEASTDPDGLIANYEWDFGDGQIGLGSGVSHTYAVSGNYTVTLTVADADLATGSTQRLVSVTVDGMPPPPPPPPPAGPGYSPLGAPSRILDTRPGGETVDSLYAATGIRPQGSTLELPTAGRAGVPADATSVVLNVTATEEVGPGFITVYPCGATQPTASNLNYVAGKNIPNLVIAKIGTGGAVCLFNSEATHLIVDVSGSYADATALVPLAAPARLLDTRADGSTIDGTFVAGGMRPTGGTLQLAIGGRANIPTTASAVVLNVTVDQPIADGFITVYPSDAGRPNASNLNYVTGQTVPNAVIARLGPGGTVCLFNSGGTHLVVDVAAYVIGTPPPSTGAACPPDPI